MPARCMKGCLCLAIIFANKWDASNVLTNQIHERINGQKKFKAGTYKCFDTFSVGGVIGLQVVGNSQQGPLGRYKQHVKTGQVYGCISTLEQVFLFFLTSVPQYTSVPWGMVRWVVGNVSASPKWSKKHSPLPSYRPLCSSQQAQGSHWGDRNMEDHKIRVALTLFDFYSRHFD